jgi:hypothetical protein
MCYEYENIYLLFICRFPLALSRFSARFEELDNRLFLLAGREYYLQVLENIKRFVNSILFYLVN